MKITHWGISYAHEIARHMSADQLTPDVRNPVEPLAQVIRHPRT